MISEQTRYQAPKIAGYGVVGGILGAAAMGAIAYIMPIPNTGGSPFFVALAMIMGAGAMAVVGGWALHLAIGAIVGVLFGIIVARVAKLRPSDTARGIGLGVLGGITWWVVAFVPAMAMAMPALMAMGDIVAGSFLAHGVYGLVLGAVVGALSRRAGKLKCESCGGAFNTQEELMNHAKEHEKNAQQFTCKSCGGIFQSEAQLMEHAKKAHPMPMTH